MILYPAVDIRGGKAVRLTRGEFDLETVYEEDPLSAATRWVQEGATHLHVVDLDGAKDGSPRNLENLRRITGQLAVSVQYGGGLRSHGALEQALEAGAQRVVLGTAAFSDEGLLKRALASWPGQIVVSVDVRGGRVATAGWTQRTRSTAVEVTMRLRELGVASLVYTDVDRDGMLEGPDLEGLEAVLEAAGQAHVIASGGVGRLEDLAAISRLMARRADAGEHSGVIVGKALYERRFTVAEALATLER